MRTEAQARANRRGLEHSSSRRFAVPTEGCDKFAPFLFPGRQFRETQTPKNENKPHAVSRFENLLAAVGNTFDVPLGVRAM